MCHFTNEAIHQRSEVRYVSLFCHFACGIQSLWNINLVREVLKKIYQKMLAFFSTALQRKYFKAAEVIQCITPTCAFILSEAVPQRDIYKKYEVK